MTTRKAHRIFSIQLSWRSPLSVFLLIHTINFFTHKYMQNVFWLLQLKFVVAMDVPPVLMNTINGSGGVSALATLNNKLFTARYRDSSPADVSVYDITSYLLNPLTIPGIGPVVRGLAASAYYNFLYVSDTNNWRICVVDLSTNAVTQFSVYPAPWGLSVTSAGNILAALMDNQNNYFIREYMPNGTIVRELSSNIAMYQAVEVSTNVCGSHLVEFFSNTRIIHGINGRRSCD